MTSFVSYIRLSLSEDRTRLGRLGVFVFVVVVAVVLYYTGSDKRALPPLYTALAAASIAAALMPVSKYPTSTWRRPNILRLDQAIAVLLGVESVGMASLSAFFWLLNEQVADRYYILGATIAIVVFLTLIPTLLALEDRDDKGVDVQNGDDGG